MLAEAANESGRWEMRSISMADVRGSHTTVAVASTHMSKVRILGPTTVRSRAGLRVGHDDTNLSVVN